MLKWFVLGSLALLMMAEGWIFFQVVSWSGLLPGLGWILLSFLLGLVLLRIEGIALLFQVHRQLQNGIVPARELVDGTMILLGALLLVVPGFLTDGVGLILLLRPLRWAMVAGLIRAVTHWGHRGKWELCGKPPDGEVIEIQPEPPRRAPPL